MIPRSLRGGIGDGMFDIIKAFLADLSRDTAPVDPGEEPRLAVAALLAHVVAIDGAVGQAENETYRRVLAQHFGLGPDATAALAVAAQEADQEAVDLYRFTSVLKRRLEPEARLAVVEMLWEVVLADGTLHEFEDNTVWRIAELLDVSTRDRVLIRKRVEARLEGTRESDNSGP